MPDRRTISASNRSPMRRGLKPLICVPDGTKVPSFKPIPDEEGTETQIVHAVVAADLKRELQTDPR